MVLLKCKIFSLRFPNILVVAYVSAFLFQLIFTMDFRFGSALPPFAFNCELKKRFKSPTKIVCLSWLIYKLFNKLQSSSGIFTCSVSLLALEYTDLHLSWYQIWKFFQFDLFSVSWGQKIYYQDKQLERRWVRSTARKEHLPIKIINPCIVIINTEHSVSYEEKFNYALHITLFNIKYWINFALFLDDCNPLTLFFKKVELLLLIKL